MKKTAWLRILITFLLIYSFAPRAGQASLYAAQPVTAAPLVPCVGTYSAAADTSISSANPDINPGAIGTLLLEKNDVSAENHILIEFNAKDLMGTHLGIAKAELLLNLQKISATPPYHFQVRSLTESFTELKATWNTRPAYGNLTIDAASQATSGTLSIDITPLVTAWSSGSVFPAALVLIPLDTFSLPVDSRELGKTGPQLVVDCQQVDPPMPLDTGAHDADQTNGLQALTKASTTPFEFRVGPFGALRSAQFTIPYPPSVQSDALKAAQWFLNTYKSALRLDKPDLELQLLKRSADGLHLTFRQRFGSIPVYPSELVVHMDGKNFTGFSGAYVPDLSGRDTPLLTSTIAETMASQANIGGQPAGDTQLRMINLALLGGPDTQTHLAWQVNLSGGDVPGEYFIDAETGAVLFISPRVYEDYHLDLETVQNNSERNVWPCWNMPFVTADDQWFDENGPHASWPDPNPPSPDTDGYTAFNNLGAVYNFWRNNLGRDSFDNHGESINAYVHVAFSRGLNAMFTSSCDIFQFDTNMVTLDIVAHEFTHGVVSKSSNLIYANESGALNESFADIFGYFVDNANWTIGEGSALGVIRNMQNPPANSQPDQYANFVSSTNDQPGDFGGVHTNSGINNKAAYLIIQGDTFNSRTISGIGETKARRLFYNVVVNRLNASSQMIDARDAAVAEANALAGSGSTGFTAFDACQVRNAYAAVGLGVGDADCDGVGDNASLDSDSDGIPNSTDNCMFISNTSQSDLDRDTLGDACDPDIDNDTLANGSDNCQLVYNPSQADSNSNGVGDACDDRDHDRVPDLRDNCISVANSTQQDIDRDGIGDACDPDRDGDGYANALDNCANNYNPDQADNDTDGVGNVCDLCPSIVSSDNNDSDHDGQGDACDADIDGDGLNNPNDNCPYNYNPNQFDGDGNGIGYLCDNAEQQALMRHLTDLVDNLRFGSQPFPIPLPGCLACTPDPYLPQDYFRSITISLPVSYRAQVVDSSGLVVGSSGLVTGLSTFNYYPAAYANAQITTINSLQATSELSPDQTAYYLQILPGEDVDPKLDYKVQLGVQTGSYLHIFLPTVTH